MADFVSDREDFIAKLKRCYPQERIRTQKESVLDWFELSVTITLKKNQQKKGSLKCFIYSHKAASAMPARLNGWREQSGDSMELHLLTSS